MIDFKEDNRKCFRCGARLDSYNKQNKLIIEATEFTQENYITPDGDGNNETEFILCDMCVRSLMLFLEKTHDKRTSVFMKGAEE